MDDSRFPRTAGDLTALFGSIDVYLFDQLLKGRIGPGRAVLDAGCGRGRNLHHLARAGAEVWAVDSDEEAVRATRRLVGRLAPGTPVEERIRTAELDDLPFGDGSFGTVVCSAVLHFATDEGHFRSMVDEVWRVLAPGGVLFARLASTVGIEDRVRRLDGRWHALPDGTDRFLVDEAILAETERRLGADRIEPLKTTVVERVRAMTTWVVEKPASSRRGEGVPRG